MSIVRVNKCCVTPPLASLPLVVLISSPLSLEPKRVEEKFFLPYATHTQPSLQRLSLSRRWDYLGIIPTNVCFLNLPGIPILE